MTDVPGGGKDRCEYLVIEDEQKVARALREGLEGEHYHVEVSATGEDGFFRAVSQPFDVIILDLMLPGRSGLEILNTLRRQGHRTPVLVLTAKDAVQDRVVGLDSGADDYLVKPFAFAELLARLRALIRRGRPVETLRLARRGSRDGSGVAKGRLEPARQSI